MERGFEILIPDLRKRVNKTETPFQIRIDDQGMDYDTNLKPVKNWDFSTLVAAGGLCSTANDILSFLSAELGRTSPWVDGRAPPCTQQRPAVAGRC